MLRNNADARRCPYFELGLPVVIIFLSFFHKYSCSVSKQRSFIRQELCHDIYQNSNSDSCHQIEWNSTVQEFVNERSEKDSVIRDKLQVLVQAFYTFNNCLVLTLNVCVLFFFIKYFFPFRWSLLLFGRFSSCVCHVMMQKRRSQPGELPELP